MTSNPCVVASGADVGARPRRAADVVARPRRAAVPCAVAALPGLRAHAGGSR
ncbi:hypothetical protein [Streptomyces sp. NPDC093970]|uniref:hypothetical protein n=1 Tax=Streptomyces sp. NPDC093970 TaxID=3155076 RepID=UPI0034135B9C